MLRRVLNRSGLRCRMLAVETTMIRRMTSSVLLLAFGVIYVLPLSAALSPQKLADCCASGMCARRGHVAKPGNAREAMPDCPMHSHQNSTAPCCEASACEMHNDNAISVGLFVLATPMEISRPEFRAQVVPTELEPTHPIFPLPETLPPRLLSA